MREIFTCAAGWGGRPRVIFFLFFFFFYGKEGREKREAGEAEEQRRKEGGCVMRVLIQRVIKSRAPGAARCLPKVAFMTLSK